MAVRPYALERPAELMVRTVGLADDLRTVGAWARAMFMSETRLRDVCRLAGVKGRDALSLVRLLRARRVRLQTGCGWQDALDIAEERTLSNFLARGGIDPGSDPALDRCLARQSFVQHTALLNRIYELLRPAA